MTREEAIELVNESLIDQDSKFSREIKALFKTQDCVDMLQQAYDMSDDNAKMSLMDATEKQFLDKFAKDGSGDDEDSTDSADDFEEDGSDIDFEEDGSDLDGSDAFVDAAPVDDFGTEETNPFADFGTGDSGAENTGAPAESSNPFESVRTPKSKKSLNESVRTPKTKRFLRKKK